jgi:hypothetical protein
MASSPARYFAPTYYSPFYFPPLLAGGGVTTAPSVPARYFAPTYYSPFYFPPLFAGGSVPTGPSPGPVVTAYREGDAFAAIVAALSATREFSDVAFGTTLDRRPAGADRMPAAVITPDSWAEADDVDPVALVRRSSFTLTIAVRDEDPVARYEALDRLSNVALNAIDGLDLGGGSLPPLTRLSRGRFDPNSKHPEQSVVLHGEFAYLIPSLTGHDISY